MKSVNMPRSTDAVADILVFARQKGLRLWSENGQLCYEAPKGTLAPEEIQRLRACKRQLISLLESASNSAVEEPSAGSRSRLERAPLAFSQLAHWNLYQLSQRPSKRLLASATRLHGRLSLEAFESSVAQLVRRHDALRTRVVLCNGVPQQEIAEAGDTVLQVADLARLSPSAREAEVDRALEEVLVEPVDVAVDPLFVIRLLRLSQDEHVLILGMEHMIADGYSRGILLHDLFTLYAQASSGCPSGLPEIPMQFSDYAVWQRGAEKSWLQTHGSYWAEHLAGATRLRLRGDCVSSGDVPSGWGSVPIQISREQRSELREWCRTRRTTLVMSMFTAYVALVLRCCETSDVVLQYQSNSRLSAQTEHTVGYFASVLHLRVRLLEQDTFLDLLDRITKEYCTANEHADCSYVAAQAPRPEFAQNPFFNWAPARSRIDFSQVQDSDGSLRSEPIPFLEKILTHLELDAEPGVQLSDTEEGISGDVYFPRDRFSPTTMRRFASQYSTLIKALLAQPESRVKDIELT